MSMTPVFSEGPPLSTPGTQRDRPELLSRTHWRKLEALHGFRQWHVLEGVVNPDVGGVRNHQPVGLLIELGPLLLVDESAGFIEEGVYGGGFFTGGRFSPGPL